MPVPDSMHGVVYYSLLANQLDSDSSDTDKIMEGKKYNYIENSSSEVILNGTQHQNNIICSNSSYNIIHDNENNILNHESGDSIAILDGSKTSDGMSPIRKFFFILSIVVCIFTVILFLWVVPCSEDSSCPVQKSTKTQNWSKNFEKIEFKGVINEEGNSQRKSKNLVFMFRSDKLFPDFTKNRPRSGVLALIGQSGIVSWYIEMINEPRSLDCTLIDANKDGVKDCLLLDEFGQLGVINSVSGEWIYYKNTFDSKRLVKRNDLLDFPLILPDVNNDGVNDLLLASSNGENDHNNLLVISGSNGNILRQQKEDCVYVHKLQIDPDFMVKYICMNTENSEQQVLLPLSQILSISKKVFETKKFQSPATINQHKFFGQRKNTESQRTINSVRGKQLILENKGKCPKNCTVSIQLVKEDSNKTKKTLWEFNATQMYSMVPVVLSFNKSASLKKGTEPIHGFIVKFWHWNSTMDSVYNVERNRFRRSLKGDDYILFPKLKRANPNKFKSFNENSKRRKRDSKSVKSNYTNQTYSNNTLFKTKMRLLKETILLIVFNSTDMRIENTSQNSIVQFCQKTVTSRLVGIKKEKKTEESLCQPDLNYQENSLLIADLDNDGEQELVSYYSTFVNENVEGSPYDKWKLKTHVQLIRLESELPKLYASLDTLKN